MSVLVISDTHGDIKSAYALIDKLTKQIDLKYIIHCGDYITDAIQIEERYPQIKSYYVPGNCDFHTQGKDQIEIVEIEGVNFLITHGDRHHVKWSLEELYQEAKNCEVNIATFGHTHEAHKQKIEEIILLNPGSLSNPRDSKYPSYAIIEIQKQKITEISMMQIIDGKVVKNPYFE